MLSLQEVKKFIDSSKLYGSSDEYTHDYSTCNTYGFVHVSGVRLVFFLGEKVFLSQMLYGAVVSPGVLWRWNEDRQCWEIDDYDFLEGNFRFRTITDFTSFYELGKKGA